MSATAAKPVSQAQCGMPPTTTHCPEGPQEAPEQGSPSPPSLNSELSRSNPLSWHVTVATGLP